MIFDNFSSIRPMLVHIRVDAEVAIPAPSGMWAMIAMSLITVSLLMSTPQATLLPRNLGNSGRELLHGGHSKRSD
jgi:hypothetical protein